jgi:hypothetical protein
VPVTVIIIIIIVIVVILTVAVAIKSLRPILCTGNKTLKGMPSEE